MTTIFSNIFSCCNRNNNENINEFNNNNDFRKESNNNSDKSKSKNNHSLSKNNNTNFETIKKNYSFIKSSSIEEKKSNNLNEENKKNNNNKDDNNNNNNNNKIIFENDKKDKNNNNNNNISCDQISISNEKNNSSLQKQDFNPDNFKIVTSNNINTKNEMNISNDNNGGSISKILEDNSISSKNSSSIKNLTNIFSKSKQNLNLNTNSKNENSIKNYSKKNSRKNLTKKNSVKVIDYKATLNLDFDNIILDEEIELAPKLLISDLNKSKLFNGNVIEIDAAGSLKGFRQKRDGMTFFGIKNNNNNNENDNNNLDKVHNDIIINFNKKVINDKLFVIFYDRKKGIYYIQNLNRNIKLNKYFMYVKIFYEFYLNEDEEYQTNFFLLGQLLISITIENENNLLNIKLYNSNKSKNSINYKSYNSSKIEENINNEDSNFKNYKEYNYLPENEEEITLGREKCTINLVNKYISRVHCSIIYDKFKNKWYICDGNGKGKYSSHGTWLILNNNIKFPLYTYNENYHIKIGEQMFNIQIKNE